MSQPVKRIVAVLLGILAAMAIVFLVEWVNGKLFPLPAGYDMADPAMARAAMAAMPKAALAVVLVGWFLGTLVGAWVAAHIARPAGAPPLAVGVILLAAAVANMYMIPHPVWFWIIGVAIYPVATWIGAKLGGTPVR